MRQNQPIFRLTGSLFLLAAIMIHPLSAMASTIPPSQLIQSGWDRGLRIVKSSLFEGGPDFQERRDEILKIVEEYFDFEEMAKRALGRPWRNISGEERREFIRLFKKLLFHAYVIRIEGTATPTIRTHYKGETIQGRYALVKTQVANDKEPEFDIDYRLLLTGTEWKVYDVVIEGISLVGNYRQQFASILDRQSFEGLMENLREKVEMESGPS